MGLGRETSKQAIRLDVVGLLAFARFAFFWFIYPWTFSFSGISFAFRLLKDVYIFFL